MNGTIRGLAAVASDGTVGLYPNLRVAKTNKSVRLPVRLMPQDAQ